MLSSCTRSHLTAFVLAALSTTLPALAQPSQKAVPALKTTTSQVTPAAQRPNVTAATSATAPKPAQSQATPAPNAVADASAPRKATQPVVVGRTARSTVAAAPAASARQKYLNVGVGLAAYYGGGLPLGASFEVDAKNNISIGGSVDYLRYGYNSGGYKWNYTFVYAGARASYHLGELLNVGNDKFDPYAGATLGFRYAGYRDSYGYNDYVSPYNSGIYLGIHLGGRYMFSEKVGGFAEVGYGVSALRLGVTAKF